MRSRKRSCDRCYAVKEKCQRGSENGTCARCERLNHTCKTARPVRPVGRRPRNYIASEFEGSSCIPNHQSLQSVSETSAISTGICDLLPFEATIIEFLFDETLFINHFVIGPTFREGMRFSLLSRLSASPSLLIDGFLACSGEFANKCGKINLEQDFSMSHCTKALQKFRCFSLRSTLDVPAFLSLGTSILTYDNLAALNTGPFICRYTLSQIKSWYSQLVHIPELDFELNCLVYLDIAHCLLHGEVPIIRPEIRDSSVIDRYVGLCYTLLPQLYDICILSHQLRTSGSLDGKYLSHVQSEVYNWQPTPPNDLSTEFTSAEVVMLSAQACICRQLALLLIHRLLYPVGQEDIAARVYSDTILNQAKICYQLCGHYPFKIGLPLLFSALETTTAESRDEFLDIIRETGGHIHQQRHKTVEHLLRALWKERDTNERSNVGLYWSEYLKKIACFSLISL